MSFPPDGVDLDTDNRVLKLNSHCTSMKRASKLPSQNRYACLDARQLWALLECVLHILDKPNIHRRQKLSLYRDRPHPYHRRRCSTAQRYLPEIESIYHVTARFRVQAAFPLQRIEKRTPFYRAI